MYIRNKAICPERSLFTERLSAVWCKTCHHFFLAALSTPQLHYPYTQTHRQAAGITNV